MPVSDTVVLGRYRPCSVIARVNEDPDVVAEVYQSTGLFVYMKPGRYQLSARLHANGHDFREIGVVRILAKQCAEIDVRLPRGGLRVDIVPRGGKRIGPIQVSLSATVETMVPAALSVQANPVSASGGSEAWVKEFVALSPGTHLLDIRGDSWKTVTRRVSVDRDVEKLEIELERMR